MHELPKLPYALNALEPHISSQTLSIHHGKHHQAYVNNLNQLIPGTSYESLSLEDTIQKSYKTPADIGIFNNAAQVWNHTFYWSCLTPQGGGEPKVELCNKIVETWGTMDAFRTAFKQAAVSQFGSGWAWLVAKDNTLSIMKTGNADLPMVHGQTALLTCDVWEHAYYLDYQNRRPDYVDIFLNHLINWSFVTTCWEKRSTL